MVESHLIQSGQDLGRRRRASRCRMDSLAGFRCRAGVGPVKLSVNQDLPPF